MMATNQVARRQLFVGNLPFAVGWQELKDLFRAAGNVLRTDVAMTPQGRSRGFGTVLFETDEEARNAIAQFNNYEWLGRRIEVREDRAVSGAAAPPAGAPATQRTPTPTANGGSGGAVGRGLYVGNLPYSVGWQDLKDLFRAAGNVVRADIPQDYQGRSKGFGTVTMGTAEEARKAIALFNGHDWHSRRIEVREDRNFVEGGNEHQAAPRPNYVHNSSNNNGPTPSGPVVGRLLFVGNLPFTVQWQELKDLFRQAGNVQRADVAQDSSGRSRGYGQVQMSTVEEAQKAIQLLNGHEVAGRAIEVREDKFATEGGGPEAGTQVYVGNVSYKAVEER
ncbi:RNA-binding domain-containing protein [Cladochytrium replicatum]|nr:RNA-binding domain-containing protein [Cladochytrium replicatum]